VLEIILTKTEIVRQILVNLSNIRISYAVLSSRMPTNSQGCAFFGTTRWQRRYIEMCSAAAPKLQVLRRSESEHREPYLNFTVFLQSVP
jgi:hypothetical protein